LPFLFEFVTVNFFKERKMEHPLLKFNGFNPTDSLKSYLIRKMEDLYDYSPYGSNFLATITQEGGIFKAMITVNSISTNFLVKATGTVAYEVCDSIMGQLRKQLDLWKSVRF